MWLKIGNTHAEVARGTDEEKAWLREYLSFPFTSWVGGRPREEQVRYYSLVHENFPAGFTQLVTKAAKDHGFTVDLLDNRVAPAGRDPNADLMWLRDYQRDGVEVAIEKTRGILWVPTGGGKTEIAAGLAVAIPINWTFLVHRSTLLDQAAERYEKRTGLTALRIGDGRWDDWIGKTTQGQQGSFTVATFQTLSQQLESRDAAALFHRTQGLIVDESHVLPADSFLKVAMAFKNAYYRLGLSGTPLARGDKRSILAISALGNVIYRIKNEVLQKAGVLAKAKIRLVPVYQESDCPTWAGVYGECIVRSAKRNKVLADCATRATKPALIFVKEIQHGKALLKRLEHDGVRADFVWGTDSTDRRKDAVKRLVRGETEVLICSVIFQEGVDIPELRSVVIGAGGKSVIAALQRIGRGMRVTEDKKEFEVWDIADKGNTWLEKHTKTRLAAYTGEGHETVVLSSLGTEVQLKLVKAV